jgi:gas vesicle protein GvpG
VFILDSLLIGSLRFVLDKIVAAAEAEAEDDGALRERLLEAEMRLELGEITADEFAAIERDVLARMREIKGSQGVLSVTSPDVKITGIEADVAEELTRR